MKKELYLMKSGELSRDQNRLRFDYLDRKRPVYIPIEKIKSIYVYYSLDFSKSLLELLAEHHIPVYFFDFYGKLTGVFTPRDYIISGSVLQKQVLSFSKLEERLSLSSELLKGVFSVLRRNERLVKVDGNNFKEKVKLFEKKLKDVASIEELMAIEGNVRKLYYELWDQFHLNKNSDFLMNGRMKRPPNNRMNSLVSFLNSMVYAVTLTEIYHTSLNPDVSFLHEPFTRRHSLSLDISEIFKPLLTDRIIFHLVHRKILNKSHFDETSGVCYLNKEGKQIVLKEFREKLESTVYHKQLGRHVSYSRLIRLEAYKLVKHIFGEKKYESLKVWW